MTHGGISTYIYIYSIDGHILFLQIMLTKRSFILSSSFIFYITVDIYIIRGLDSEYMSIRAPCRWNTSAYIFLRPYWFYANESEIRQLQLLFLSLKTLQYINNLDDKETFVLQNADFDIF